MPGGSVAIATAIGLIVFVVGVLGWAFKAESRTRGK
jgi:hypothetical protein